MTAPMRGTPRLSGIPASHNTAPVAEFRCLFTHDMRRKQKRWQDGFLKFHSFNSRVMVYDAMRNFLGDTYWKESSELGEGDELTLDKGVMVEVAEPMGVTQTDLTPLFEKKPKQSPRGKSVAAAPPGVRPLPAVPPPVAGRNSSQLRHKSLNTLLGNPKGPIGKSVPLRSPYEARKEKENDWTDGRAPKRRKIGQEVIPLISSSPVESGQPPPPARNLPLWARTADAKEIAPLRRPIPHGATVISLDSEPDHVASDITLSSTSPRGKSPRPAPTSMPAPAVQGTTPQPPKGKIRLPQSKAKQTPQPPPRSSSPPVSVSNRVSNIAFALETAAQPVEELSWPQAPPREPKIKLLRLSKGNKRGKMLMCQSLPQELVAPRPEVVKERRRRSKDKDRVDTTPFEPIPFPSDDDLPAVSRKKLIEQDGKRKSELSSKEAPPVKKALAAEPSSQSSSDAFEDMAVVHGLMDQRLLAPVESARNEKRKNCRASPAPKLAKAKTASKRNPQRPRQDQEDPPPDVPAPSATNSKQTPATFTSEGRDNSPVIEPAPRPKKTTKLNPPPFKIPPPEQQAAQPLLSPISPREPTLSTAGFRKKPKRTISSNTNLEPAPIRHKHTTVLPASAVPTPAAPSARAPLKAPPLGRKRTTELTLLLDPIEDLSQTPKPSISATTVSPNRSFRRVRSENDAPIPSTSADWEERNLPNPDARPAQERVGGIVEPVKPAVTIGLKLGSGLGALVKKTDPRRKFVRTQSLNVDTSVGGVRAEESVSPVSPSPVVDTDVGPWSTEAFDLFDWRPPRKEEDEGEGEDSGLGMLVDR